VPGSILTLLASGSTTQHKNIVNPTVSEDLRLEFLVPMLPARCMTLVGPEYVAAYSPASLSLLAHCGLTGRILEESSPGHTKELSASSTHPNRRSSWSVAMPCRVEVGNNFFFSK